ncbi:DinB family protein [Virgibacillus sp. NKC19-3]|uniref:DinB family protein n=1 Tax=Virgibacillus saliphilus TaxID=2831674 RepID=UPI001C9AB3F2|nr:DinB family protein [Virgibacillus sp. NKC19-3]MBY7142450.1 DinB family protein [Virgibacillus sp. NKC19-3]
MYTTENLINDFENFNLYVSSLKTIEENLFFEPIAEGKWSTAETISHISFWDRYIREETLPRMKLNAVIESIDFETLNKQAAKYALSGVSQQHLLQKKLEERTRLVSELKKRSEKEFFAKFILNGEEIDKYSGYPHTIFNYIAGFQWHDNHHKQQIDGFLKKRVEFRTYNNSNIEK